MQIKEIRNIGIDVVHGIDRIDWFCITKLITIQSASSIKCHQLANQKSGNPRHESEWHDSTQIYDMNTSWKLR